MLAFEYNLRGKRAVVILKNVSKLIFFGDIHGDLDTLYVLCKKIDLIDLLKNNWYAVFLGDYVDRGYRQLEALSFIALLKSFSPSRVIMLRGNHEPYKHLIPYPHDYPEHLEYRFGYSNGLEAYELSRELFDYMPIMLYIPGKILAVHGGPPILRIQRFNSVKEILSIEEDQEAIEDILWSDPIEDNISFITSYRGAGKLWGIPITKLTLQKLGIRLIIRGHEPVNGYQLNHNGSIVTLFSMKGYYGNSFASCLKLSLEEIDEFRPINSFIVSV